MALFDWNISRTAEAIGIQRSHLYNKMNKYEIQRGDAVTHAFAVRDQLIANEIYDVAIRLTENWGSIRQISAGDSGFETDALNRYAAIMLLSEPSED